MLPTSSPASPSAARAFCSVIPERSGTLTWSLGLANIFGSRYAASPSTSSRSRARKISSPGRVPRSSSGSSSSGRGHRGDDRRRLVDGGRRLDRGRRRDDVDRVAGEVALDVAAHRGRGLVAVLDPLGQRLHHDGVDLRRHLGVVVGRGSGRLADVLVGDRDGGVADERRPAGQQLVEQAAGGVDVGPGVDRLAAGLLRREVLRGADHGRGLGHRAGGVGHRPGDAEVHHLHVAGRREHHVAGLDVAVDDAGAVAVVERRQHAAGDLERPLGQDLAALAQDVAQGPAGDELHDDVGLRDAGPVGRLLLAGVVDGHDRGVVQRRGALRLAAEAGLERDVAGQVGPQALDGDDPSEPRVGALADLRHAASAEQLAERVAPADQRLSVWVVVGSHW